MVSSFYNPAAAGGEGLRRSAGEAGGVFLRLKYTYRGLFGKRKLLPQRVGLGVGFQQVVHIVGQIALGGGQLGVA